MKAHSECAFPDAVMAASNFLIGFPFVEALVYEATARRAQLHEGQAKALGDLPSGKVVQDVGTVTRPLVQEGDDDPSLADPVDAAGKGDLAHESAKAMVELKALATRSYQKLGQGFLDEIGLLVRWNRQADAADTDGGPDLHDAAGFGIASSERGEKLSVIAGIVLKTSAHIPRDGFGLLISTVRAMSLLPRKCRVNVRNEAQVFDLEAADSIG